MDCYRCGQEGHSRSECPERWPATAATRASPVAVTSDYDRVPLRHEPDPPTPQYLQAREQVGIPSHAVYTAIGCPWCRVGPYQQCINVATQRATPPHQGRLDAAGIKADTARRDIALRQVTESRAARGADLDAWWSKLAVQQDPDHRDNPHDGRGTDDHAEQDQPSNRLSM